LATIKHLTQLKTTYIRQKQNDYINRPNDSTTGCNCTVTIMPTHCAEFRNEPVSLYATKSPPYLGGHDALPSPIRHFGGTCTPCPTLDLCHRILGQCTNAQCVCDCCSVIS